MIQILQPASIDYGGINGEEVASLETRLDGYLREQFMNWRRQHTGSYTVFNRYCTQIIKQLLPKLEYHSAINGARNQQQPPSTLLRQFEEDFIRECDEIYSIHKVVIYFPMNLISNHHPCTFFPDHKLSNQYIVSGIRTNFPSNLLYRNSFSTFRCSKFSGIYHCNLRPSLSLQCLLDLDLYRSFSSKIDTRLKTVFFK